MCRQSSSFTIRAVGMKSQSSFREYFATSPWITLAAICCCNTPSLRNAFESYLTSLTSPALNLAASRYQPRRGARYFSAIMRAKKLIFPRCAKLVHARTSGLMWLAVRQTRLLRNRRKFLVNTTWYLQKQEALWKRWRLARRLYFATVREPAQWSLQ